jgi:Peptidase C13 family
MPNVPNASFDPDRRGKRYAILVSGGNSYRRQLNDLEFCYRMLTEHYGFASDDVAVLYFHGARTVGDGPRPDFYPDEGTNDPYRIKIDGKGKRSAFKDACTALKDKLKAEDLVFIHINGHGYVDGGEAYLLEENGGRYFAGEFCEDLKILGPHAKLLIMMQQCFSAGFIDPVIDARINSQIKAQAVSIACASAGYSGLTDDELFNCFSKGWIAAHVTKDPWGNALKKKLVTDDSGFIEAWEAYGYGKKVKNADDDPRVDNEPPSAQDIRLA